MSVCSLEDDEYGNIFITQEPKKIVDLQPNFEVEDDSDVEFLDLESKDSQVHYSDISDDDSVFIPCSQQSKESKEVRQVLIKLIDIRINELIILFVIEFKILA